ncbi:uncharacterized protein BP01DRAFT_335514 [Aspergillus saccharolyticus JOP 1030-1]|uniref:S-adenosyl-L-methionine-dependent methyltransferase n=1 Tax=Aspergillus saccharolyticus JOP 1030-1 TaxID=1450539 RepID=A0A319A7W9_9EURO|nr:hypothetical protein BP01DRAFT_335514 [Aspergillus saccharolyticus JOP 1030-1]PYH47878.1 hypothetical protein BP01DRAFT_335514 [Aspergillus saccharolyticus JOP 1030-1]
MNLSQLSAQLTPHPQPFPNCCLALSSTLTTYLATNLLPAHPHFTVSIGSGSGLLEALISYRHPDITVEGVEVRADVNRYIDELDMNLVPGTWGLCERAAAARAWMFVYPREPGLVRRYLESGNGLVQMVVWLGPQADWMDYAPCFDEHGGWELEVKTGEEVGVAAYEMLVVMRRREVVFE